MVITRAALLEFLRSRRHAAQASARPMGGASAQPQAAVVGIAVSDDFDIVFDTLDSTRKVRNLRVNPRIAFVIGGFGDEDTRTVQCEGFAAEPGDAELQRAQAIYFSRFPEGRERKRWKGITWVRTRLTWLRYSDFSRDPPEIVEFTGEELRALA